MRRVLAKDAAGHIHVTLHAGLTLAISESLGLFQTNTPRRNRHQPAILSTLKLPSMNDATNSDVAIWIDSVHTAQFSYVLRPVSMPPEVTINSLTALAHLFRRSLLALPTIKRMFDQ